MYNISFLLDYIKLSHLTKEELSKIINVDILSIDNYLNGELLIDKTMLIKLLDYFNIDSFARFKSCIVRITNSEKRKIYDLSFLGKYMAENKITIIDLSKLTHISSDNISKISKGKIKANDEQLNKILKFFNVSSKEELEELVKCNIIPDSIRKISSLYKHKNNVNDIYNISKNLDEYNSLKEEASKIDEIRMITVINKINLSEFDRRLAFMLFFSKYDYDKRLEKISKIFGVNKEYIIKIKKYCIDEYEIDNINYDRMEYVISNIGMDEKDEKIACLLFLAKNSKYTDYAIASLTNVSYEYVLNIKKICLDQYYLCTPVYKYKRAN